MKLFLNEMYIYQSSNSANINYKICNYICQYKSYIKNKIFLKKLDNIINWLYTLVETRVITFYIKRGYEKQQKKGKRHDIHNENEIGG